MKAFKTYLKKREAAILAAVEKPRRKYKAETFHRLRVEIKKLNALFDLLGHCSRDFKHKKHFRLFKELFQQAGLIRGLQMEEAILAKYQPGKGLSAYMQHLKNRQRKEKDIFFSLTEKIKPSQIRHVFHDVKPFLKDVDSKLLDAFIKKRSRQIELLIRGKIVQKQNMHELRKRLKTLNYARRLADPKEQGHDLSKVDELTDLLGKWHDHEVVIAHLKKTITKGKRNQAEYGRLGKVATRLSSENRILFLQLKTAIARSAEAFNRKPAKIKAKKTQT